MINRDEKYNGSPKIQTTVKLVETCETPQVEVQVANLFKLAAKHRLVRKGDSNRTCLVIAINLSTCQQSTLNFILHCLCPIMSSDDINK